MDSKRALLLVAGLFLISGCLGKLEKLTEDTKTGVFDSVKLIRDTEDAQKLAGSLNLLFDEEASVSIRTAAAETMFMVAAPDRLYKYLGATMELKYYSRMWNKGPNVSFVGTKGDEREHLSPISPGAYKMVVIATMRVLRELSLKAQTNLSNPELEDVKNKSMKMFLIATAVLGAEEGPVAKDEDKALVEQVLANKLINQEEAAGLMRSMTTLFDEEVKAKVERLIEVRFQSDTSEEVF